MKYDDTFLTRVYVRPRSFIEGSELTVLGGWHNTVGNLIAFVWLKKTCHGPQTGTCVKHRGVRFHRIRDFKQYGFSIPPPPQIYHMQRLHVHMCTRSRRQLVNERKRQNTHTLHALRVYVVSNASCQHIAIQPLCVFVCNDTIAL